MTNLSWYSLYFQVDIFVIDSVFLGKLSSIRIGHSETKLGTFLISSCVVNCKRLICPVLNIFFFSRFQVMVGSWTKCLSRKVLRQHEHLSLIVTGNDKTQKYTASVENCDVWTQTENKSYFKSTEKVHLDDNLCNSTDLSSHWATPVIRSLSSRIDIPRRIF